MLKNLPILLCGTAPKNAPIMLNKCPYYAQIMLIKLSRVRYYTFDIKF